LPEDLNRQHPQLFTTQQCIDEAGMDVPELKVGLLIPCEVDMVVDMTVYERCVKDQSFAGHDNRRFLNAILRSALFMEGWSPSQKETGPAAVVPDEVGMGEVILEISGRALEPTEAGNGAKEAEVAAGGGDDDAVMTPRQEDKGPDIPSDAVVVVPYYEMK
ncbi:hypothetical protein FOZ62_009777, partial [Perkinsus olseni]